MHIYAIIKTGGREYRVSPGKTVKVERMQAEPGESIEFDKVCKLVNGDQVATGQPLVEGALVRAQVVKHGQEKGIMVFRMKRRRIYKKKFDRERQFTSLKINEIVFGDAVFGKHESDPRKIKRAIASLKTREAKKATVSVAPKPDNTARPAPAPSQVGGLERPAPASTAAADKADARKLENNVTSPRQSQSARASVRTPQESSDAPGKRRWLVAVIIALLVLLALFALFWNKGSAPQLTTKQKPIDIRPQQTKPVDRPSAPTQPPE